MIYADDKIYSYLGPNTYVYIQRRKYAAIEFDNRLLLERLATIVQHKTIDNEMSKETTLHHTFRKQISVQKKKMQMHKLTEQNHR